MDHELASLLPRLGKELILARRAAGLTQQALATRLGTTQSAIARIEAGAGGDIKLSTLVRITTAISAMLSVQVVPPRSRRRQQRL